MIYSNFLSLTKTHIDIQYSHYMKLDFCACTVDLKKINFNKYLIGT